MRRLLCAALAATILLALPCAASAAGPLVVGIGEQSDGMFASTPWQRLRTRDVRYIVAWDALDAKWQRDEVDSYMAAAENAGARVLLGFSHSRSRFKSVRKKLPSPRRFRKVFLRFRARYPFIREYLTWNEANHRGQPTWNHPKVAGRYYDILRNNCHECTIVAPSVLDSTKMPGWVKQVEKAAKHRIGIWAIHNYIDANRFRTRGTRSLLRATKAKIWFTETGGLVRRDNGSKIEFAESPKHAVKATRWVLKLARLSPRIRRVYFYHWTAPAPDATWDSALTDRRGRPRPAYAVVRTFVRRLRVATRLHAATRGRR
ncbi:MAG: glycosyl hydrolase [Solirubrobacteraceae bacterium]